MRSLRVRLAVWFGVVFLVLVGAFTFLTKHTLETELRQKSWQKDYPEHPDWKLHGSFSEDEVLDITNELMESAMIWSVPLVVMALAGGYWLARHSLRPIANVNRQLQEKNSGNLGEPIQLAEMDDEFRALVRQLNELLSRLDVSFTEMNNYAAKVAHELRTPLAILRLKVEQADGRIVPELVEELENELHRLTYVVDQSLLIARAERGLMPSQPAIFNLANTVRDLVEDFQLLTTEQGRHFTLQAPPECWVYADVRQIRQIIHTLLTNALMHGQGDFTVRVSHRVGTAKLLIVNRTSRKADADPAALGLGLRVVAALLRPEPDIRHQRRRGNGYYVALLKIPAVKPPDFTPILRLGLNAAGK